jgi:hypothetical protein
MKAIRKIDSTDADRLHSMEHDSGVRGGHTCLLSEEAKNLSVDGDLTGGSRLVVYA